MSDQAFAGVFLVDRRGWILLQERDDHAPIDPERWGLAGGHLDDGEAPLDGAARELAEETGVRLDTRELTHVGTFTVDHRGSRGTWDRMDVYAAATELTDDDIECHEGRQIVFVDPAAARGLELTSAAAQIVPAFLDGEIYRQLTAASSSTPDR